jgi:quercetin dioxygenase-like cupin family protein
VVDDCGITRSRQERITRGNSEAVTELAGGVVLREFASAKLGAMGLSTGMVGFSPGARLPYHQHHCGESITLLKGEMEAAVEGRLYSLLPPRLVLV